MQKIIWPQLIIHFKALFYSTQNNPVRLAVHQIIQVVSSAPLIEISFACGELGRKGRKGTGCFRPHRCPLGKVVQQASTSPVSRIPRVSPRTWCLKKGESGRLEKIEATRVWGRSPSWRRSMARGLCVNSKVLHEEKVRLGNTGQILRGAFVGMVLGTDLLCLLATASNPSRTPVRVLPGTQRSSLWLSKLSFLTTGLSP